MVSGLFGNMSILEKSLDASMLNQKVIANNIANVDTPNFKTNSVEFEDILKSAIEKKDDSSNNFSLDDAIKDVEPKVVQSNATSSMRTDGNNVDIDSEMAELSKNTIKYDSLIQELSSSFKRLSYVINGGR